MNLFLLGAVLPFRGSASSTKCSARAEFLRQANVTIEQPVQCFRVFGQLSQAPIFESCCECIEQRPDVALLEFLMLRFTPLVQHIGNQTI